MTAAKSIFGQALAIESPPQRAAYLDQACGGDAALRAEVEGLLAALEKAGAFLEKPAVELEATVDSQHRGGPSESAGPAALSASEAVGSHIGPYKLVQLLGEGGMGVVWVAEQTEPVQRRVALKVIKPGMDSAQILRRFEAERQALALMDHTHIATVFDAGTTATGRPYFVMELIKGVPITTYCDELHLPIRERLALFIPVCQAIQHAHQKGIIHRDLKPSNVLVCIQDGKPVAKVIDFGVAKAVHQKLANESLYTEIGQIVGTLEYMSPEQAELSALDIDTRADVYALGVLLYELLTGSTPLDKTRLKSAAILELLRLIREEEPPRPSTRLTNAKNTLASLAAQRRTEPARLTREVRGELDWIVMKCLEKDRTRRYEAASSLARDIEHYLHDEPVEACPPSAGYRLKKMLRRNKGPVAAAAAVFLALLVGVMVSTWQAVRASQARAEARQQRDDAEAARRTAVAERDAKERARAQAEANEREERAVRDFLQNDLLRQADAETQAEHLRALGEEGFAVQANPTVQELLERAAAGLAPTRIGQKFPQQPLVQAEILATVGNAYRGIGEYDRAIAHLERAADLVRTHLGPDQPETLTILHDLANAYGHAWRMDEAIALYEKVRDARTLQLGPDHPDTLTTRHQLALCYLLTGRKTEALALFEQVHVARAARLGLEHRDTLKTLHSLAWTYREVGRTAEAVPLLEKVLDTQAATLGADHPDTADTRNSLALAFTYSGREAAAIALYEKVRDEYVTQLAPNHPTTLNALNNLAIAYRITGRLAEAISLFEQVRDARAAKFGPNEPATLNTMNSLARAYRLAGRAADAIALFEQVRDARLTRLGPDHVETQSTLYHLALSYTDAGKPAQAIPLYEQVREVRLRKLGPDHPDTLKIVCCLAQAYCAVGKQPEGIEMYEQARDAQLRKMGPTHADTLRTLYGLALAYRNVGRNDEAIPLFEQVRDGRIARFGPTHPDTLTALYSLAIAYRNANRLDEAIALFEQVRDVRINKYGPDHVETLKASFSLARAYRSAGRTADAIAAYEQVRDARGAKLGVDHPDTKQCIYELDVAYNDASASLAHTAFFEKIRDDLIAKFGSNQSNLVPNLVRLAEKLRELASKQRKGLPPEHPRLASTLAQHGLTLLKAKKPADAELSLREALSIREKKEPYAWTTFYTQVLLGASLLGQKQWDDAEPLMLAGYEGMKRRTGRPEDAPPSAVLTETLAWVVQLYEAAGKKDIAKEWRKKLEDAKAWP